MTPERDPDLSVAPPRVTADDAFVARLAATAGAATERERRRTSSAPRMLLAAASVAAIATGGAFAAAQVVTPDHDPARPEAPQADLPTGATATLRLVERDRQGKPTGPDGTAGDDRTATHDEAGGQQGRSTPGDTATQDDPAVEQPEQALADGSGEQTAPPGDDRVESADPDDESGGDTGDDPGDDPRDDSGDGGRLPEPPGQGLVPKPPTPGPAPGEPDQPGPGDEGDQGDDDQGDDDQGDDDQSDDSGVDETAARPDWWSAAPAADDTRNWSSTWDRFVRETVSRRGPHHGTRGVNGWQPRSTSSNVPASETPTPGDTSTSP